MRALPRFFKVVVLAICSILFVITSLLTPLKAAAYSETPYMSPNFAPGVQPTMHNFMQSIFLEMLSSGMCFVAGTDPLSANHECLGINSATSKIGYVKDTSHGLLGVVAGSTDFFYQNPPAHTKDYIAYMGSKFGFTKAYADQGVGYLGISPLIGVWVTIRNLAYLFAILAFVGIGFAIMLRVKIDPRTVMTIQNSIPKIIIGLVLITFSFAISGLLIDAMYAAVNVVYNVYASVPGIQPDLTPQLLQENTPLGIVNSLSNGNTSAINLSFGNIPLIGGFIPAVHACTGGMFCTALIVGQSLGATLKQFLGIHTYDPNLWAVAGASALGDTAGKILAVGQTISDLHSGSFLNALIDIAAWIGTDKLDPIITSAVSSTTIGKVPLIGGPLASIVSPMLQQASWPALYSILQTVGVNIVPTIAGWLIIYIALLIAMVRLFFALLQAWLFTLFYIALSPLFILFGMIPKSKTGFTSWLRGLAANLLAFPITAAILLFGNIFIQEFSNVKNYYIPPLLGGQTIPVGPVLAVAVFFMAANGPAIAKGILNQKDDKNTAGAFGVGFGGGIKILTSTGKGLSEFTAPVPGGAPGQRTGWRAFTREFMR